LTGVIVVDVANVVGSRPDGWWRDRAGAARRLYDQVVASAVRPVVLVLEGAARSGLEPQEQAGVRVLHAPASGDDCIVESVEEIRAAGADEVTVVTSDRDLRRRVAELGADVVGPRWFLERLG
jgi:predicted RNA-binding protein with PIN domain